jgi:hypothetical protein
MKIINTDLANVLDNSCSCVAGKGFCQHQVGLLYQLSHYQSLCLKKVPEIASSTSTPQKWHIPPRTHGFAARSVTDVTIVKPVASKPNSGVSEPSRKRRHEVGIQSKLYNPINIPLANLNIPQKLLPTLSTHIVQTQWLQLWSGEDVPLVDSQFGKVPHGSLLSYQEKPQPVPHFAGPDTPPPFALPDISFHGFEVANLPADQVSLMKSLQVTPEESFQYEKDTRDQSLCPEWHKLRKNRITASRFKSVTSRRGKFHQLARDMLSKKTKCTQAMQFGIDNEQDAAVKYSGLYGVDIHKVGFVINPSAAHLGCSPDRRVFDADESTQWGLLEVKCSLKHSVSELPYLKVTDDGLELRRSNPYYDQCMGQMGLTGAKWCDLFVLCEEDFHCERIHYDEELFKSMKMKLDSFFVTFLLPEACK